MVNGQIVRGIIREQMALIHAEIRGNTGLLKRRKRAELMAAHTALFDLHGKIIEAEMSHNEARLGAEVSDFCTNRCALTVTANAVNPNWRTMA